MGQPYLHLLNGPTRRKLFFVGSDLKKQALLQDPTNSMVVITTPYSTSPWALFQSYQFCQLGAVYPGVEILRTLHRSNFELTLPEGSKAQTINVYQQHPGREDDLLEISDTTTVKDVAEEILSELEVQPPPTTIATVSDFLHFSR